MTTDESRKLVLNIVLWLRRRSFREETPLWKEPLQVNKVSPRPFVTRIQFTFRYCRYTGRIRASSHLSPLQRGAHVIWSLSGLYWDWSRLARWPALDEAPLKKNSSRRWNAVHHNRWHFAGGRSCRSTTLAIEIKIVPRRKKKTKAHKHSGELRNAATVRIESYDRDRIGVHVRKPVSMNEPQHLTFNGDVEWGVLKHPTKSDFSDCLFFVLNDPRKYSTIGYAPFQKFPRRLNREKLGTKKADACPGVRLLTMQKRF